MTSIVKKWSTGLSLILGLIGTSTAAGGIGRGGGTGLTIGGETRGLTTIIGRVL
jgi:hypothetical protein